MKPLLRYALTTVLIAVLLTVAQAQTNATWRKLNTEPYRGKQDDICFVGPNQGWYVNGGGHIYHTTDGGETWGLQLKQPGTFFRCIGFVDSLLGFAGNIGPGYFPGVTDSIPLYKTTNGGKDWAPVTSLKGTALIGLCAIEIFHKPIINSGVLSPKTSIWAGGRVGGPAVLIRSEDLGNTWSMTPLEGKTAMLLDIKMTSHSTGFICGGTQADVQQANANILRTTDAGRTWTEVFRTNRPFEITWKGSFPTPDVGYVTIQSYNPDTTVKQQYIAKTTDAGRTWKELKLVDKSCREFGIGFIDTRRGWVGTLCGMLETQDGGASWQALKMGRAVNKVRVYQLAHGRWFGAAIGLEVYKWQE